MKLQTKSVSVDGFRWTGNHEELFQFFAQFAGQKPVLEDNVAEVELTLDKTPRLWVKTNRGNIEVRHGDWVLRTVDGEFFGMKHSVFEVLFEDAASSIDWKHYCMNLLARIHRDGGHYVEEHGVAKAVADADVIVAKLLVAPNLEECDECHATVPEYARSMEGTWHEKHCSLHAYPDIDRE